MKQCFWSYCWGSAALEALYGQCCLGAAAFRWSISLQYEALLWQIPWHKSWTETEIVSAVHREMSDISFEGSKALSLLNVTNENDRLQGSANQAFLDVLICTARQKGFLDAWSAPWIPYSFRSWESEASIISPDLSKASNLLQWILSTFIHIRHCFQSRDCPMSSGATFRNLGFRACMADCFFSL